MSNYYGATEPSEPKPTAFNKRAAKRVALAIVAGMVLAAAYSGVATLSHRGAVDLIEYETVPLWPTFLTTNATTCCDDLGIMCFDGVASPTCADDADPRVDTPRYYCCCNGAVKDPVEIPSFFSECPARNESTTNVTLPSLYDMLSAPAFSTLKGLVDTASIQPLFKGEGKPINLTLFAPTDAAFAELAPGVLDELRADPVKLIALLSYHLLPQKLWTLDLQVGLGYATLYAGEDIVYTSFHMLNGHAGLIQPANQEASNGILHAIDAVLTKYLDVAVGEPTPLPTLRPTGLSIDDDTVQAGRCCLRDSMSCDKFDATKCRSDPYCGESEHNCMDTHSGHECNVKDFHPATGMYTDRYKFCPNVLEEPADPEVAEPEVDVPDGVEATETADGTIYDFGTY